MAKEVFMPKAGMDMQEGTIISWFANEGDSVRKGEALLEIETDKVSMEVESPADGILLKRYFDDGAVVPVVTIIGYIGEAGESVPDRPSMAGGQAREADEKAQHSGRKRAEEREYEYRAAVIGGGPAGYTAAMHAARLGERVVLFEKADIGGTCINSGCIPLKTYLGTAREIDSLHRAAEYGIKVEAGALSVDFDRVAALKRDHVLALKGEMEKLLTAAGVTLIREDASMIGRHHIRAGKRTFRAENTIICSGSKAAAPDIPGADLPGVLTPEEMLAETEIPSRMIIIGGGVIGCEMACAWNRFGTDVIIAERQERILPTFDEDISEAVAADFTAHGIRIITNARMDHIERNETPVLVFEDGTDIPADRIIPAVGRVPDLTCLGVLKDQLDYERGKIMVDENCRTSLDHIFACGDITNRSILAHSAMKMGVSAADAACGNARTSRLNRAPLCLYTIPEAAGIGLTEKEARRTGDVLVGRFPFSRNSRALTSGHPGGFVKVIADKGYGEILGVHIVGSMATEMIVEAKTMMDMEITVYEVADIMHPHPTLSEAFMEACADAIGESLFTPHLGGEIRS